MNQKIVKPPTPEQIASAAYMIWKQQGCPDGHAVRHWLQAEQQLNTAWACTVAASRNVPTLPASQPTGRNNSKRREAVTA